MQVAGGEMTMCIANLIPYRASHLVEEWQHTQLERHYSGGSSLIQIREGECWRSVRPPFSRKNQQLISTSYQEFEYKLAPEPVYQAAIMHIIGIKWKLFTHLFSLWKDIAMQVCYSSLSMLTTYLSENIPNLKVLISPSVSLQTAGLLPSCVRGLCFSPALSLFHQND